MQSATKILGAVAAVLALAPMTAKAAELSFVNVGAPAINCVFSTTCTVTVTDSVDTIAVSPLVWTGTARLQTRTFGGGAGSPAAGKTAYEYRVDLTPGSGHSSYFFGLTSAYPPKSIGANVSVPGLDPIKVKARGPNYVVRAPRQPNVGPL